MRGKTQARKSEHIDIVLGEKTQARGVTTGFERFFLEHVALPEINLAEVDLSLSLWGRNLRAPLLISCMTGGTNRAGSINLHLAEAAQALGIAMGVGSQRAVLEARAPDASYQVRKVAPDILLLANLGAVQLNYGFGPDQARRAVEDIEADALVLHLNPLQEAVQPEGDQDWRGLYQKIENVAATIGVPVIAKEVGNGIGAAVARRLHRRAAVLAPQQGQVAPAVSVQRLIPRHPDAAHADPPVGARWKPTARATPPAGKSPSVSAPGVFPRRWPCWRHAPPCPT